MRVHCDEGTAYHIGPEPCVLLREGLREASAGDCAGQPLSRESIASRVPTLSSERKAKRMGATARVPVRPGVVKDPGMYGRSLHGNREVSRLAGGRSRRLVRIGKARSRSR